MNRKKLLARLTIAIAICAVVVSRGQFVVSPAATMGQDTAEQRRGRIAEIMQRTLKGGEGRIVHNGQVINTYTRRGPTDADLEEIRRYGEDAVPILTEYLASKNAPEYELAMRFLGAIGGSSIVPSLKKVIFQDQSSRKREYAVRTITQAPRDAAAPILRRAAARDADPKVRRVAKEMLKSMKF